MYAQSYGPLPPPPPGAVPGQAHIPLRPPTWPYQGPGSNLPPGKDDTPKLEPRMRGFEFRKVGKSGKWDKAIRTEMQYSQADMAAIRKQALDKKGKSRAIEELMSLPEHKTELVRRLLKELKNEEFNPGEEWNLIHLKQEKKMNAKKKQNETTVIQLIVQLVPMGKKDKDEKSKSGEKGDKGDKSHKSEKADKGAKDINVPADAVLVDLTGTSSKAKKESDYVMDFRPQPGPAMMVPSPGIHFTPDQPPLVPRHQPYPMQQPQAPAPRPIFGQAMTGPPPPPPLSQAPPPLMRRETLPARIVHDPVRPSRSNSRPFGRDDDLSSLSSDDGSIWSDDESYATGHSSAPSRRSRHSYHGGKSDRRSPSHRRGSSRSTNAYERDGSRIIPHSHRNSAGSDRYSHRRDSAIGDHGPDRRYDDRRRSGDRSYAGTGSNFSGSRRSMTSGGSSNMDYIDSVRREYRDKVDKESKRMLAKEAYDAGRRDAERR